MAIPLPVVLSGSSWAGNDGNWSALNITVGTPPQQFFVLPSSTHGDVWVPLAGACTAYNISGCASSRGIGSVNGAPSAGFVSNASTSWDSVGIYALPAEQNLFGADVNGGLVGLDSVVLGSEFPASLHNQTINGILTADFWLGSLGLGLSSTGFSVVETASPSILSALKSANYTASTAYGLYVGAHYESDSANVVLGGFDRARSANAGVTINISTGSNNETSLVVSLRSLQTTNTFVGTRAYPDDTKYLSLAIDPTVAQLWLPQAMCDKLAAAFGLLYQNNTGYYVLNATTHDRLVSLNPQLIFTVAADAETSSTTVITLPYAAFDQYIGYPVYSSSVRYFPLRRAANDSQLTLGRVFLQEAYLVVDHERGNFTIAQATHGQAASIVTITPPPSPSPKPVLSAGAIVGIVIGVLVVLAGGAAYWLYSRRRRQRAQQSEAELFYEKPPLDDPHAADPLIPEADSKTPAGEVSEIFGKAVTGEELMSTPVHELSSVSRTAELDSRHVHELSSRDQRTEEEKVEAEVHELSGSTVERVPESAAETDVVLVNS